MVKHLSNMVDMAQSPKEAEQYPSTVPSPGSAPKYPYGLCICLCEEELEKLNLDHEGVEPGDMLHLHCMATVTSKSTNETQDGDKHCRIELQITHIAAEDEDEENEENEEADEPTHKRLYK